MRAAHPGQLAAALLLGTALAAVGQQAPGPSSAPPRLPGEHGGVVARVQDLQVELVATPHLIRLYLRRDGPPVDMAHSTAKLLLSQGANRQAVQLRPAGDRLEAAGQFELGPGTVVEAMVTTAHGPALTARFVLDL